MGLFAYMHATSHSPYCSIGRGSADVFGRLALRQNFGSAACSEVARESKKFASQWKQTK